MTDQNQVVTKAPNALGILLVVCTALFFGVVNTSAVAGVLPDISADLSVDSGQVSWLMTGFMLVYGIAIPFYGRLADIYGARPLFLLGVTIFCIGSLLSALAPNYEFLLTARIVQAAGGAAVPGLGMTLASRAYGPEARGSVLGVIAATIGVGGGIGPLLGGALSESLGWESLFFVSVGAAISIPVGLRILPRDEDRTREKLDLLGGGALALMVSGALLVPSEGARSGWFSPLVLTGIAAAVAGLILLSARQLTAGSPFIPKEFLRSSRYVALVGMSSTVMAAYIAPIIALPVLLAVFHDLPALEVGLVMVPGAILTSLFGVFAGRLTDRRGARLPTRIGAPLMLLAARAVELHGVLSLDHSRLHGRARCRVWTNEYSPSRRDISHRRRADAGIGFEYQLDGLLHWGRPGYGHRDGRRDIQGRTRRESAQSAALRRRGRLQRRVSASGRARDSRHCAFAEAPRCG